MAKQVIRNATVIYGHLELQSEARQVDLSLAAEAKETTNLAGDGWREFLAGLKDAGISVEGMFDQAAVDLQAFTGEDGFPFFLSRERPIADGDTAYALQVVRTQFTPGFQIGEVQGYQLELQAGGPLVRGTVLHAAEITVSADGDAQELGAISATQRLYAGLFVLEAAGTAAPTLDVVIESDAADTFAGAETARITFGQVTDAEDAARRQWETLDGAITDTWWRATATLGGTDPSFRFVVFWGVGAA